MRRRKFLLLTGAAMTLARALRAQQKAMPVIGFLNTASPGSSAPFVAAFLQGLRETGYVEAHNVALELEFAGLLVERRVPAAMIIAVVQRRPDIR